MQLQEPPPDAAAAEAADGRGKREDGENSKDGAVTVRYLNDLTEIRAKFRGTNSQSLAELWFGLLRCARRVPCGKCKYSFYSTGLKRCKGHKVGISQ